METGQIVTIIVSALGSASLAAIVTAMLNRKKTKVEIESVAIKNIIEVERVTKQRYDETLKLIDELRREIDRLKAYNRHCIKTLKDNGLTVPVMEAT